MAGFELSELNLPPFVLEYLTTTPLDIIAAHALLALGWIPLYGIIVWGLAEVWLDYKQEHYAHHLKWIVLEIRVPQMNMQTPKGMENFFSNLMGTKSGLTWKETWLLGKQQAEFSFELVSDGGNISFYIRCQEKYRDIIEADLYAQYPEAQITPVEDYVNRIPKSYPNSTMDVFGAEVTLKKDSYYPIRTFDDFEHQGEKDNRFKDPLLPILEFFGKVLPGEQLWLQVIIKPPENEDWVKEGIKFLGKIMGKEEKHKHTTGEMIMDTFTGMPGAVIQQVTGIGLAAGGAEKAAKDDFRMFKLTAVEKIQIDSVAEKISKVGWRTKIRYVTAGPKTKFRKGHYASGMKGIFQPFTSQILNAFVLHGPSVPKDDYFWMAWQMAGKQKTLVRRYRNRSFIAGATPVILNAEELATLWHFPSGDARTPVLSAMGARRAEAPTILPATVLGTPSEMMDWKKMYGGGDTESVEPEAAAFAVPAPASPTATSHHEDAHGHGHDAGHDVPPNLPV